MGPRIIVKVKVGGQASRQFRHRGAVQAALTTPWSNDQTEGQVNRLKFLKRQMYGRANFDLLRLRALHPSCTKLAGEPVYGANYNIASPPGW